MVNSTQIIDTIEFSNSTDDCGIEIHNELEIEYFEFMRYSVGYSIISEGTRKVLNMTTPISGQAIFKNFKLNMLDYDLSQIEIYHNPSYSLIHIKSPSTQIMKIKFFNF